MIHWKYSRVMNMIFVALIFGPTIPLIFPAVLLGLIVQYTLERFLIAYYYKQPPAYNELLSKNTLVILKWAIVIALFLNYWMFSNKQLFGNDVHKLSSVREKSKHSLTVKDIKADQALPIMIFGFIFFFIFSTMWTYPLISRCCYGKKKEEKVEEGLQNYFKAIDDIDKEWWNNEEKYIRMEDQYKMLFDSAYEDFNKKNLLQIFKFNTSGQ